MLTLLDFVLLTALTAIATDSRTMRKASSPCQTARGPGSAERRAGNNCAKQLTVPGGKRREEVHGAARPRPHRKQNRVEHGHELEGTEKVAPRLHGARWHERTS